MHETGGCPAYTTSYACGLSTALGSPPETVKDRNQVKVSANLNPPVSEFITSDAANVLPTVHDPEGNDTSKDEGSLTPEVVANLPKEDAAGLTTKGKDVGKRQPVSVTAANKVSTVILVVVHNPSLKALLI